MGFETKRQDIDKNESQKVVEKQTISLEGAPMLVEGIYSVRDVQLALNNVKANATVVGSSNVVIVYSKRKGAHFTCAKDKKGTWRVGKNVCSKKKTRTKFRPIKLQ